ncbi:MAG: ABC transporter ATP-binding protein [Candidatus Kerfeldbacteria bacterium]|nr:ABC transporter ATP-binding protein [Candidatus Kerfeldbacteria bacterium]
MLESAIQVNKLSKEFRIPHERITTMRGFFVNIFKKKRYEDFLALDNVSFSVQKGEFFGIIGKNGSGKSTLLKILAGIYRADTGKIKMNGRISPFLELGIGFNPELSGRQNIYLNGAVLGMTKQQIDKKFDDIVTFSELERFIDQKLKNYSSGMQVRLAFSVAIHANRDILLMDEVLAVGDANFQQKCLGVFRHLQRQGKTIIFVSHDMETMKQFADRVLVLHRGKVVTISAPERAGYEYSQILMREHSAIHQTAIEREAPDTVDPTPPKQQKKKNRIVGIQLLNQHDTETQVFEYGDDIRIRIEFDVQELVPEMYVGLGIIDKQTDAWICGNNTYFDRFNHHWKVGKNTVVLKLPNTIFHKGDFYILSSFFIGDPKENAMMDFYDSREHNFYFRSFPRDRRNGLVLMDHEWKQ